MQALREREAAPWRQVGAASWELTRNAGAAALEDAAFCGAPRTLDLAGHVLTLTRSLILSLCAPEGGAGARKSSTRGEDALSIRNGTLVLQSGAHLRMHDFARVDLKDLTICLGERWSGSAESAAASLVDVRGCGRTAFVRVHVVGAALSAAVPSPVSLVSCRGRGAGTGRVQSCGMSMLGCRLSGLQGPGEVCALTLQSLRCVRICGLQVDSLTGARVVALGLDGCSNCAVDSLSLTRLRAGSEVIAGDFRGKCSNCAIFDPRVSLPGGATASWICSEDSHARIWTRSGDGSVPHATDVRGGQQRSDASSTERDARRKAQAVPH